MKYAFLVYLVGNSGNELLFASVPAAENNYDGIGYLQPDAQQQVLERAAAYLDKLNSADDFKGVRMVHPATEFFPTRVENWEFVAWNRAAKPMSAYFTLTNGRTVFGASYRKMAADVIKLQTGKPD